MTTGALLRAEGLTWEAARRRVLGPLDLAVRRGEHMVVVGPNGAGKTTLLRLLTGLLPASSGRLSWEGRPYSSLSRRDLARRLAYVPQIRPARVPFTVGELVLQGRYPHLSPWQLAPAARDFAAADEALEVAGIAHLRHRPLDELSGGERQSAYIAAALAQESEVLVLDEPTTHLDPRHQRDVAALLLRLRAAGERTAIIATHDLNFAALLADRVAALKGGRLLACDTPGRILDRETLGELFDAPFQLIRGGGRPLVLLEMAPAAPAGKGKEP